MDEKTFLECERCGSACARDAAFCSNCGARVGKVGVAAGLAAGPVVSGAFAALAIVGSTQTWARARALMIFIAGTEGSRGVTALVAGLLGIALCAGRLFFGIRDRWYLGSGLILSAVALAMPVWYVIDIYREPLVDFGNVPGRMVEPGFGAFLTMAGAFGYGVSLCWQFVKKARPE